VAEGVDETSVTAAQKYDQSLPGVYEQPLIIDYAVSHRSLSVQEKVL
jgi:hypothetical protein